MGGAGGHMWHPFDCPDVNSGQDLLDFFRNSVQALRSNPAALKIDGVNLSFRLKENPGASTGYEFVVDRGSMKPLDVEGVTADNAHERFVSKDPDRPHGMVEATKVLLNIFNNALPSILPELEQLGMTENANHLGLYFNTEFVLKKINVKEYPFNFIAIHGLNKFVPKGPKSRKGVVVSAEQTVLDEIRDKVQEFANAADFRVFTKIPARVTRQTGLEDALNEQFTIVYRTIAKDPEEPGEIGAGEGSTKPIKAWLQDVTENPINKVVRISDSMRAQYPNMGKKQTPYAKNIYLEVLRGTAVTDIAEGPEDVEAIVDGVVIMHATRILGNAVLDSLDADEFGSARNQEGVVVQDPNICNGTPFKFTGDFIVGGLASTFEEAKFRTGPLLESWMPEPVNLNEAEDKQTIILLPGGFKPPTGGHFSLIQQYDKNPNIRKVFVITGDVEREGVTLRHSKEIFDIYGGFSDKVEFIETDDATPLTTCYELMKNSSFVNQFPNARFSIGAGDKGQDPQRIQQFVSYFNKNEGLTDAEIWAHPPAKAFLVDGKAASASRLRKAFFEEDWETFKKLLPNEAHYDDVVQVLMSVKEPVNENFLLAVPQYFLGEGQTKTKVTKPGQERVSKKIAHLIGKEEKDPKQAAAIAYSMEKRGELTEQGEEVDKLVAQKSAEFAQATEKIREKLTPLIASIVEDPEIANFIKTEDDGIDVTVAGIVSYLMRGDQITEMSSMAGGDGQGYAGSMKSDEDTLIGEEEDEQKRTNASGN